MENIESHLSSQIKEIQEKKVKELESLNKIKDDFESVSFLLRQKSNEISELNIQETKLIQQLHDYLAKQVKDSVSKTKISFFDRLKNNFMLSNFNKFKKEEPKLITYQSVEEKVSEIKNETDSLLDIKNKTVEVINSDKEIKVVEKKITAKKETGTKITKIVPKKKSTEKKEITIEDKKDNLKVIAEEVVEIKIEEESLDLPTTKQEGVALWVKYDDVTYDENKLNELYTKYSNFLTNKFGDKISVENIYSQKGPAFKLALRKILVVNS